MTLLFELRGVGVEGPLGPLLAGLDWAIHDHAVTVLLGPAGTGKSALLRGLAGRPFPEGWRLTGSWRYQGVELSGAREGQPPFSEIAWAPQLARADLRTPAAAGRWRDAFRDGARTLLLDEPTRGASAADVSELAGRLRARTPEGAAVVVTHDLDFARRIADQVCLVCAGGIVAEGDASSFFSAPPNELAAQFLRQGNCWPAAKPPELPSHFHWILPGQLAGMGRPGLLGDVQRDLEAIAAAGATLLVSLTEEPIPVAPEALRSLGLAVRHFPIPDMGVPGLGTTAALCREIERATKAGGLAVVHCHAGMGRTGTILAAMLVWLGRPASDAVEAVRCAASGYIQNRAQLDFVRRFDEVMRPGAPRRSSEAQGG